METNDLEKLVAEIKAVVPVKDSTEVGDLVLIIAQNPQMFIYAQVTSIERDPNKRDEWWNIGLTFLTVPLQKVVWTLRTAQMTGKEIFTMGGEKRFFQSVDTGIDSGRQPISIPQGSSQKKGGLKRIK